MNSTYDNDGYSSWIDAYAASTTSTYGRAVNYSQLWTTAVNSGRSRATEYPGIAISSDRFPWRLDVSPSEDEKDVGFDKFEEVLEDASR